MLTIPWQSQPDDLWPFGYTLQHLTLVRLRCCFVCVMGPESADIGHRSVVNCWCLFCTVIRPCRAAGTFMCSFISVCHVPRGGKPQFCLFVCVFLFYTRSCLHWLCNRNLFSLPPFFFSADIDTETTNEWHAWIMWWLGGSGAFHSGQVTMVEVMGG